MTILGPGGRPVDTGVGSIIDPATGLPIHQARIEVHDAGMTYSKDGEQIVVDRNTLLMAVARRQRDGASLEAIISEFQLVGEARNRRVLQNAINEGHVLLNAAIERGEQPGETFTRRLVLVDDDDD